MGTLEVVLLVLGLLIFACSFFVSGGSLTAGAETKKIVEAEARQAVSAEMDNMRLQWENKLNDSVEEVVDKTERTLERVSNEKIMAVNEYSDTVLNEIDRNHKEVMFLYDMLSDKHKSIVALTKKEQELRARVQESLKEEKTDTPGESNVKQKTVREKATPTPAEKPKETVIQDMDISFVQEAGNNNDKILRLHKEGKSNVAIAKELGLGVGEVKLVIDLFEGIV